MRKIISYISILVLFQVTTFAQSNSQEEYLNSNPKKEEFNQNHWKKIKKTMVREAKGNAKAKDDNFNRSDFEDNRQNESYYEYQEESYNGEYAKNNGERDSDYNYKEDDFNKGEGSADFETREENSGTYYSKKEKEKADKRRDNNNESPYSGEGLGTFGSILLYTILAVFLGFIIYILFINTTIKEEGKNFKEVELEKTPVEIDKSELKIMLEEALVNNDYRLAIRIYFIFVLKDLAEKKWIDWKKEKTNLSYLIEMREKKQYDSFNESVSIFELVWYGNYAISNADYKAIEPKFTQLLKELSQD